MDKKKNLSVIGLGKLGASMIAGFASRGFNVIGVDVQKAAVEKLAKGEAPVKETDLAETLYQYRDRITATMSHEEAVLNTDISFVIVPTPSDNRGAFSLQYAMAAFESIGKALKKKPGYHVVVLTSTVLPGSTRSVLIPVLENASGKVCGKDFGVCYSPEFIALGSVIRDFLNPDLYLVGEFDKRSGDMLEEVNLGTALNKPAIKRMSLENAEIAKIALNSYVTLKISYANLLSEFCERIPGGDVDIVTDAIGQDSRVGKRYLTGGLGFGGPCFPRDNVALSFMGRELGVDCTLLDTNDGFNRTGGKRIVEKLKRLMPKGESVAVLGLAYKPKSHVVEESQGLLIARELAAAGYRVLAYDPLAAEEARGVLGDHVLVMDDMESCLDGVDAVVVATPDDVFKGEPLKQILMKRESALLVVDCWRCLPEELKGLDGLDYVPLGRCLNGEIAGEEIKQVWSEEIQTLSEEVLKR